MFENFNDQLSIQKEEEEERNNSIKKLNPSLNSNLNAIEENEENIGIKEEEHLSEEENLGYNSNFKFLSNNIKCKDNQNIIKRKASTSLSTTISQNDTISDSNSFLPSIKTQNNDRKTSYPQPGHVYFGRDRLNSSPITTYLEGMDFYLSSLYPEKNDYQKTNNYIEKEIFFKEKNFSFKDFRYKSFDLSEKKKFNPNQIIKNTNLEENTAKSSNNKITSTLSLENNSQNQNNINNINNNQKIFTPIMPKLNNYMYGKFDTPMYYFGYYNFDCKYIYNFIFLF